MEMPELAASLREISLKPVLSPTDYATIAAAGYHITTLVDEVIRLKKIEKAVRDAKVPKSADGAYMFAGMCIYHGEDYTIVPGCVGNGAPITINGDHYRIDECYSYPPKK